ncbi:hypothetical protein ACHAXT_001014 [Thalassiosira profunda]
MNRRCRKSSLLGPCGGAEAIGDEALAPLRALLQTEQSELYIMGRSYLAELSRWRDLRKAHMDFISLSAKADAGAVLGAAAAGSDGAMTPALRSRGEGPAPRDGNDVGGTALSSGSDRCERALRRTVTPDDLDARPSSTGSRAVRPEEQPELLLQWRAKMISYFFQCVDHCNSLFSDTDCKFELNTATAALSYLDAYSMSRCFPKQWMGRDGTSGDADTPPPGKKAESHLGDAGIGGMEPTEYELAARASLYIAIKVYQSTSLVSPSVLAKIAASCQFDGTASSGAIEEMELRVLEALGHRVHPPTSHRFIQELLPLLLSHASRVGDARFANDSGSWSPRDDIQQRIYEDAGYWAALGTLGDAVHFPALVAAVPSKIALAAIAEAAGRVFHQEECMIEQDQFQQRIYALEDAPYDEEVKEIQRCLFELHRLRKKGSSRGESPTTVIPEPAKIPTATSSHATSNDKENVQVASRKELEKHVDQTVHSNTAAIHQAVKRQSGSRKRSRRYGRRCPGGRNHHRMWECAADAMKPSGYYGHFAAEEQVQLATLGMQWL